MLRLLSSLLSPLSCPWGQGLWTPPTLWGPLVGRVSPDLPSELSIHISAPQMTSPLGHFTRINTYKWGYFWAPKFSLSPCFPSQAINNHVPCCSNLKCGSHSCFLFASYTQLTVSCPSPMHTFSLFTAHQMHSKPSHHHHTFKHLLSPSTQQLSFIMQFYSLEIPQ